MRFFLILAASISLALGAACSERAVPNYRSADVYFRAFDATSIVTLTEEIMVTSAGSEIHITDNARLARIVTKIDVPCNLVPGKPDDMDLRVLIYFSSPKGRVTWKADTFSYFDGSTGELCAMTPALRSALSAEFGAG